MSTFDDIFNDHKLVGLLLVIVGAINILVAIILIVYVAGWVNFTAYAVGAIGVIIFGILLIMFGMNVRNGPGDKVGILSGLVRIIGLGSIIKGIFLAAEFVMLGAYGLGVGEAIVGIIVGLFLLWVSTKIAGANKNAISNILWILLVLAFLIMAILCLLGFFGIFLGGLFILEGVGSLCMCIVYVYALLAALSPEVKASMGI